MAAAEKKKNGGTRPDIHNPTPARAFAFFFCLCSNGKVSMHRASSAGWRGELVKPGLAHGALERLDQTACMTERCSRFDGAVPSETRASFLAGHQSFKSGRLSSPSLLFLFLPICCF